MATEEKFIGFWSTVWLNGACHSNMSTYEPSQPRCLNVALTEIVAAAKSPPVEICRLVHRNRHAPRCCSPLVCSNLADYEPSLARGVGCWRCSALLHRTAAGAASAMLVANDSNNNNNNNNSSDHARSHGNKDLEDLRMIAFDNVYRRRYQVGRPRWLLKHSSAKFAREKAPVIASLYERLFNALVRSLESGDAELFDLNATNLYSSRWCLC